MRYENFEIQDFLQDEYFVRWVRYPTPETNYFWKLWLEKHPEKRELIALAKEIVLNVNLKAKYYPSSSDIIDVLENINKNKKSTRSTKRAFYVSLVRYPNRYAAIFLILIIAGGLYGIGISWFENQSSKQNVTSQMNTFSRTTERGKKLSMVLPDGTQVKLNSETKITFYEDSELLIRVVNLEGEAFFDVARDESKPFKIYTDRVETTVLGTSFNINAYPENENIVVAVLTGKVQVESKNSGTLIDHNVLAPQEMYTFNKENLGISKSRVSMDEIIAWKNDIIIFKDASFQEIKNTLERWYGVEFVVEEGVEVKEDFSGQYKNQSLERILESLNFTSKFSYKLEVNKVFVKNK
ncbi:FecR domain-containing protein [Fulvivirgaceae bacterium BMA10]|uniref:FecR domain-containing protein n=1 Tax=Splendidivirga corallicola TaxID=3051826 RepID=A0ABT8KG88_9BACT|nr:FecR domain-containing protein [Fulvivirgaceae bacterium BMA10]